MRDIISLSHTHIYMRTEKSYKFCYIILWDPVQNENAKPLVVRKHLKMAVSLYRLRDPQGNFPRLHSVMGGVQVEHFIGPTPQNIFRGLGAGGGGEARLWPLGQRIMCTPSLTFLGLWRIQECGQRWLWSCKSCRQGHVETKPWL